MPNAGLPAADRGRRALPADARGAGRRARHVHPRVRAVAGRRLLRHDARAPPAGRRARTAAVSSPPRKPRREPGASSLYQHVPFRQDTSYLSIGERTNANGSKAFREAMLAERWDDCVEIARDQTRDGAHLLDLCVDYVGRDGVADMRRAAFRLATASTLPIVLDSTEPAVIEAGLESLGGRVRRQLGQLRGRRRPALPVRPDHAARQGARRRRRRPDHRRGGPGPHRRAEGPGRRAADRRPDRRVGDARRATSSSTA